MPDRLAYICELHNSGLFLFNRECLAKLHRIPLREAELTRLDRCAVSFEELKAIEAPQQRLNLNLLLKISR